MTEIPANQLDPTAVSEANQQLWADHPELHGRQLTMDSEDAPYRREWMKLYFEARAEPVRPPAPFMTPAPVDSPPSPVVIGVPHPCAVVEGMSHEQKMEEAIKRAPISDAIRKQLGDIPTLVGLMVATTGALIALAATGYGAVAEAISALLLVAGAAIGGYDVGGGIASLIDFYEETQCDSAKTPEDLDKAGKSFADSVAKMGVGGLTLLLSFAGAEEIQPVDETPKVTVLGHFPEYLTMADEMDGNVFSVPKVEWDSLTPTEQWAMNQQFLDDAIARGDRFVLSTPPSQARPGSFYARELEYLQNNGYEINDSGTELVPKN